MAIISGSTGSSGAVVLVATTTAAASVASLSFTSIPQTFNHLRLVLANARSDLSTPAGIIGMKINADSTALYDIGNLIMINSGVITATGVAAGTTARIGAATPATAAAGATSLIEVLLPLYAGTTFYKTWVGTGGRKDADSLGGLIEEIPLGSYRSTAAITGLSVQPFGASATACNFVAGASAQLYGIT